MKKYLGLISFTIGIILLVLVLVVGFNRDVLVWPVAVLVVLIVVIIAAIRLRIARNRATNSRLAKLKAQMKKWGDEGYNVSKLKDLFK
jgi:c-di-AMP phosphodiesterase-like protein